MQRRKACVLLCQIVVMRTYSALNTDTPVIKISDLHKSYGQLEVLKGVDLVAPRGAGESLLGSAGGG